ncbi:FxSxx-COOH system tetratricopeptide repeat protein [Microbacterium binotii]|nr:FxSxx-COOH system tetratricopeptide repeat protein [Microbacterium binotii]
MNDLPPTEPRGRRRKNAKTTSPSTSAARSDSGQPAQTNRTITVANTGAATATNGGIAVTGFIESLTVVHEPSAIVWPVSIGRIPPLASAFQPRLSVRRVIEAACRDTAGAVLTQGERSSGDVLSGGGGVGKTQLGSWYASEAIRQGTDLVVWVDASAPGGIPEVLARAGQRLRVPGVIGLGTTVEKDAAAFRDWLQATHHTWLVVFDDITDPQHAADWWPVSHTGTGSSLATTRRRDEVLFAAGRRRIDVDVFTPDEALDYLNQRVSDAGRQYLLDVAAPVLVEELGCLPLALSHAAAYLLSRRVATSEYLALFREEKYRLDELMVGDPDNRASVTITVTLLLAIDAARHDDVDARIRRAAAVASMLSPVGHPIELWNTPSVRRYLREENTGHLADGLRALDRYSLVTIDDQSMAPTVRMHALTARAVREQLAEVEAREAVRVVASAVLEIWPDREHELSAIGAVLRANAATLAKRDAVFGHPLWRDGAIGLRLSRRASYSWVAAGHYTEAIAHAQSAISATTSVFGETHSTTAIARVPIITAYRAGGDLSAATKVGEETLEHLLDSLGANHPITLEAQDAVAVAHRQAGNHARAIELVEAASAGRDRVLGEHHPDALESRNNVAVAYWNVGRIAEAIVLHERTLADRARILGADHPDTMESRNNLAVAYWQDGRHAEAVALGLQVFNDRSRLLGPDHPRTLESQHNLTSFYRDADMFPEAVALGKRARDAHIRVLGADHHRTLNSRHVLAMAYLAAGMTVEAVAEAERAVADCLRVLGSSHRYTLAALTNLSEC